MLGVVIALAVILLIVFIARSRTSQQKSSVEEKETAKPSAVLKMDSIGSGDTLICRDNAVYLASSGRMIGYYQNEGKAFYVYCDEGFKIGSVYNGSDIVCGLSLDEKFIKYPHLKEMWRQNGKRDTSWWAAEAVTLDAKKRAIIDRDSYAHLGFFEGDFIAGAAAFICWAYQGYGNPYSDFYKI